MALTKDQFFWKTVNYFLGSTGIPVNFGITITLGFVVGAAVTGHRSRPLGDLSTA